MRVGGTGDHDRAGGIPAGDEPGARQDLTKRLVGGRSMNGISGEPGNIVRIVDKLHA